jgi:hypothetical protein
MRPKASSERLDGNMSVEGEKLHADMSLFLCFLHHGMLYLAENF